MPLGDYKVQLIFQSANSGSWSSVFYRQANTLADAADFGHAGLFTALLSLMPPCNVIKAAKITDLNVRRSSVTKPLNYQGTETRGNAYPVSTAAVLTLVSTIVPCQRKLFLRGLSDYNIWRDDRTGATKTSAGFDQGIANITQALNQLSFEILPLVRVDNLNNAYANIVSVDGTAVPGQAVITLDSAPWNTPFSRVIISQVTEKDLPRMNGHFDVVHLDLVSKKLTIKYETPGDRVVGVIKGKIRPERYQSGAIIDPASSGFSFFASRKSADPTSRTRGARRGQRLRLVP